MATFTDEQILRLDERYAQLNVPFHARPLRAAIEILGEGFSLGIFPNPAVEDICRTYERLVPEVTYIWPGMGTGLVSSLDRVKAVKVSVAFGTPKLVPHEVLGFTSDGDWGRWCRNNREIAAKSMFAFADIFDLVYGIDDSDKLSGGRGPELWGLAASHLEMTVHSLEKTGSPLGSQLQPVHLTAELALKGTLVQLGVSEEELSRKPFGHNLVALAERMVAECPHPNDPLVLAIAKRVPNYVENRYSGSTLTRLEIIELAIGTQFIAGSAVRRVTQRDLGKIFESSDWPGPRGQYFR